jgi:hypothetical protein
MGRVVQAAMRAADEISGKGMAGEFHLRFSRKQKARPEEPDGPVRLQRN